MARLSFDEVETLGRQAAHMGMTAPQLAAIFTALRFPASLAAVAETTRRRRLLWIAEGMGHNEAELS